MAVTTAKRVSLSNVSVAKGRLALYEDDSDSEMPSISSFLKSFSGLYPEDRDQQRPMLGTIFGVYLPSIQHILGVQMFLRLLWIVGVAGVVESFIMVFLCCLCTFLTSISISAIATNGKVESGGTYYMISRNLGAEFGGAIGVLFYLANTVATSMYIVGGIEILLVYIAPDLPRFGTADSGHELNEQMFNNFRLYGSACLILIFIICCMGVRFVQFAAPVSLSCVLFSIVVVYLGAFMATEVTSPRVCILGDYLFNTRSLTSKNHSNACNKTMLTDLYCITENSTREQICESYYVEHDVLSVAAIPGFNGQTLTANLKSSYMRAGEVAPGHTGPAGIEVSQDMSTSFFVLMAIFFPSVTGIMTGANMSGDLRDPQQSIPVGTIAATVTTSVIYLSLIIIYGGSISGPILRDKYGVSLGGKMVAAVLAWPSDWILLIGSFTSCIGAALQCLCSAPRLLQSIAKDNLLPFLNPFRVVTARNEPFRALLITTLIAECAILIGGIDYIAPVVDLFFLLSYCFCNIACALQTFLRAPNWRPRFRFYHWSLAVLGALLNLFIMFSTYWHYAFLALAVCAMLYKYIEFKGAKQEWGDGIRGLALTTAQYSLLRIEDSNPATHHWRPQLLVYINFREIDQIENVKVLHFASQLKAGRGLTMVTSIVNGELTCEDDRKKAESLKLKLTENMKEAKVKGFTEVVVSKYFVQNVDTLLQCVGMGCLRPNTFVVAWPQNWKSLSGKSGLQMEHFLDVLSRAARGDICLLVPKGLVVFPDVRDQLTGFMDIWWIVRETSIPILLASLLQQHKVWRACKIRVFALAYPEDHLPKLKKGLQKCISHLHIEAAIDFVDMGPEERSRPPNMSAFRNMQHHIPSESTRKGLPAKRTVSQGDISPGVFDPRVEKRAMSSCESLDLASSGETLTVGRFVLCPRHCDSLWRRPSTLLMERQLFELAEAKALNSRIMEKSSNSRLVLLPLPSIPEAKNNWDQYVAYLDALTEGIARVLLIRSHDNEFDNVDWRSMSKFS
uniref:Amino acid permease/ SLC12A domain-containing protein n=1 Tax=Trichuris muris TaxID=70415 RepID=A0A5S6QD85_TRIMR